MMSFFRLLFFTLCLGLSIIPSTSWAGEVDIKQKPLSYIHDVKPILDSRCVACHGCYDSPCQLKLTSFEGLSRGATKNPIYDYERLKAVEPTRLFIDETSTTGWRNREFFSVINEQSSTPENNLDNSLIAKLLQLKRNHPLPATGKLPADIKLDLDRTLQCPKPEEFNSFQSKHPHWGMPYGLPALTASEENTLLTWIQQGAKNDSKFELSRAANAEINHWEVFFNGELSGSRQSLKKQLSARYIYEHLFIGDLHFEGQPADEFYKLVRSRTPPGQPIVELKSSRPFDDPGGKFYYRFRPNISTIVDKDHFVYQLSAQKMLRFRELFLTPDYQVTELPSYQLDAAANPFQTFAQIPASSRYQFLLDDAQYFFSGFIKGPVCRGQAALNVIRDQFWVAFLRPQPELNPQLTRFLAENHQLLKMPASHGENIGFLEWREFNGLQNRYLNHKEAFSKKLQSQPMSLNSLWQGDGQNENALLTVFRHDDNATVVKGLMGKTPLTAWVVDYPLFERIHYLLVAGYNVYGSAGHQVTTRLYMDFLRMEAENNFLRFVPSKDRQQLHDSWYEGIDFKIYNFFATPKFSNDAEPAVSYQSNDYKHELYSQLEQKITKNPGHIDLINRCIEANCKRPNTSSEEQQIDEMMRQLANLDGLKIAALPELTFLRVLTDNPEQDPVYTLIRNKKLLNVSFIFAENFRREPEKDTLTVVPGFIGSYPNQFFSVPKQQLSRFIDRLQHTETNAELDLFFGEFAIRRTNSDIWVQYDWFNKKHLSKNPENAGLFDISRYKNL
ncbi:MAG: fatty acid cis/trans isomerase [Methylococcales bacterium]|nr:fatty acid cis/trans isomerase [Methylococcaceae bacterium]